MKERQLDQDPYWCDNFVLTKSPSPHGMVLIWIQLHQCEETNDRCNTVELVPLSHLGSSRAWTKPDGGPATL